MSTKEVVTQHLGTKFLFLFIGMVLATIYALLQFFTKSVLTMDDLYGIARVEVFFVIVWVLIGILGEIIWRFAHKYSEKFPIITALPLKFYKLKTLSLLVVPISR